MGLFLSKIHDNIQYALEARESNSTELRTGWYNKKTPWVRFTSLASVNGDENLRKKWILHSGTNNGNIRTKFNDIYDSDNKPMPGITNVSVTNKGSMGSVREANISFQCWSLEQLNNLQLLFMTFGIHCLLEWGWSFSTDGNPIESNLSVLEPQFDRDIIEKINHEIFKVTQGNYDAMQGPVSNFSWSLNENGGFECSVTIVSTSSMFLEMDIHSTTKNIKMKNVDNENDGKDYFTENILATIENCSRLMETEENGLRYDNRLMGMKVKIEMEDYEEGDYNNIQSDEDIHYFIKWEFLEKIILNENIGFDLIDGKENETLPLINSDNVLINYKPKLISGNPLVCILPQKTITFKDRNWWGTLTETVLVDDLIDNPIDNKFHLKNILVNLRCVYKTFKETKTLNEFLNKILDEISESCGNLWDFGVIVNEDNPTEIKIVDYNTIDAPENKIEPYIFKVYNVNSIVKSCDLSSQVDEKIKAMIMYGVNKEKSDAITNEPNSESTNEYNLYGKSVTNLVVPKLKTKEASNYNTQNDDNSTVDNTQQTTDDFIKDMDEKTEAVYNVPWPIFSDGATPTNIDNLKLAIQRYVTHINKSDGVNTDIEKKFPLMPLKLSLTIDGISGIKFGNVISIDYLPDIYKNAMFQITNVSHSISKSNWDTTFETIMRIKQ